MKFTKAKPVYMISKKALLPSKISDDYPIGRHILAYHSKVKGAS
jgi:hypothetical protein